MEFTYNTVICTQDEVVPTVQSAIDAGKWLESSYQIGDSYILTFCIQA